jgi:aldehyde dehydrogenase (NAD+)
MSQQESRPSEGGIDFESDWSVQYIGGEWVDAGDRDTIPVEDPSTGETLTEVPAGTEDDVDAAYEAAREAQAEWAATPVHKRASIVRGAIDAMDEYFGDLIGTLVAESGSAGLKAKFEIIGGKGMAQEAAGMPTRVSGEHKESMIPGKDNLVKREPAGVVTVISPWNYPHSLSMRAVAPAIALGNSVVLKPASNTPVSGGLAIARLFEEAGVPEGVINVVTGRGSEIGDAVAGHPESDVVAFTGSTEIGKRVAKQAVENLAFPAMELGGNAPFVVLEDADVEQAVDAAVYGSFYHSGQACISINRHLVHEDVYDEYVDYLTERVENLPTGSAHDDDTVVGPIIDESQRDQILEFIEDTVDAGATLETGGDHDGLVVEPTVLSDVTNDMAAACNEHFGPVAPVIPFSDEDEGVELANDTEYGLSAAVFSGDVNRAETVADQIDAGMVHVNDQPINEEPHVPFGGMKSSGIGRYNGEEIIGEFTEAKWVSVQRQDRRYPF